jgi:hypothetical protein
MSSPAINTSRFLYPEDRMSFVFGRPGEPIRTPPRTGLKLFLERTAQTPADILDLDGNPIPFSTVYTGADSLLPEFYGPPGFVSRIYARIVGGTADTYPLMAQYSDRLANLPMLVTGNGPPSDAVGAVGSFYIDQDLDPADPNHHPHPVLYGPRLIDGWPDEGVVLIGPQGEPGSSFRWIQNTPALEWVITHPLTYRPNVATIDSAGMEFHSEVVYPPGQPQLVIVRNGAPESGEAILS